MYDEPGLSSNPGEKPAQSLLSTLVPLNQARHLASEGWDSFAHLMVEWRLGHGGSEVGAVGGEDEEQEEDEDTAEDKAKAEL